MILRDVIYAEQRRLLPDATSAEATMSKVAPLPVLSIGEVSEVEAETITPSAETLTMERVVAWMAEQEIGVRSELAARLATELEAVYAEAVKEGQTMGAAAAQHEINARFEPVFSALNTLVQTAEQSFLRQREELMTTCVAVVGEALAKLVGRALQQPEASMAAVKKSIEHISGAREVTIRVNARELEVIESKRAEIAEALGGQNLSIVADPRVTSGGCLIESSFGEIDARWETQLLAMIDTLRSNDATLGSRT